MTLDLTDTERDALLLALLGPEAFQVVAPHAGDARLEQDRREALARVKERLLNVAGLDRRRSESLARVKAGCRTGEGASGLGGFCEVHGGFFSGGGWGGDGSDVVGPDGYCDRGRPR